jgi:hypothetical protein
MFGTLALLASALVTSGLAQTLTGTSAHQYLKGLSTNAMLTTYRAVLVPGGRRLRALPKLMGNKSVCLFPSSNNTTKPLSKAPARVNKIQLSSVHPEIVFLGQHTGHGPMVLTMSSPMLM